MTIKHGILMWLLCLIPIVGFGILALFNIQVDALVWVSLLALCPLSHFLMLRSMRSDSGNVLSQEAPTTLEE